jgi:hypothetical protein
LKEAGFELTEQQIEDYWATLKECSSCKTSQPRTEFGFSEKNTDGFLSKCRDCLSRYRQTNVYGITEEELKALLSYQGLKCAICKRYLTQMSKKKKTRVFSVDHNHKTGRVRGLLCFVCNRTLLGMFTEERLPEIFRRAADYLENPPALEAIGERFIPKKEPGDTT